jgi:hypothetical protein
LYYHLARKRRSNLSCTSRVTSHDDSWACMAGRYCQSDLAKLLESKPTSQQQLMSVQQKSLPHPHGCHRVSPQAPALKPRVFPPPQNASWPVSPHPSWDFGDQSLCRRLLLVRQNAQHGTEKSKQRIMLAQTTGKLQPLQHARRVHGPAFGSCCGPGERPQIPGDAHQRHQALPSLGIRTPPIGPETGIHATEKSSDKG